ncbi:hypothetical protein SKAU_G00092160 [Synaphobranchus kaupii]|uniref:Uncharacterized protein n=1 Tax=Synaphobranchus kaupii TaxID=118154 RepID=A0A9Q1FWQ8_SYNKA|nr:hypothetical protein SKAU_G00092160 [Synaphobranchus kaupii]
MRFGINSQVTQWRLQDGKDLSFATAADLKQGGRTLVEPLTPLSAVRSLTRRPPGFTHPPARLGTRGA